MGKTILNWFLLDWLQRGVYVSHRYKLYAPVAWSGCSRVLEQVLKWQMAG